MKLYPYHIKLWSLAAIAAASGALTGCSDEIEYDAPEYETYPSDCLAFTTTLTPQKQSSSSRSTVSHLEIVEEQWVWQTEQADSSTASRGQLVQHLSGSAGVLGFQYDYDNATGNDKTAIAGDGNNVEFEFDGDKLVAKNTTILWNVINKKHLNVYAYAPYVPNGTTGDMTLDFNTAPPTINYTVPDKVADQKDILVARWISTEHEDKDNPENYKNKTIPLVFDHELTAIRFKVAFDCTVKSVEIKNVYNKGTYNLLDNSWDLENNSKSHYKLSFLDPDGNEGISFDANNILEHDDGGDLILMPQILPEDAEIVFTTDEGEYPIKIGKKEWAPGKLITYTFHKGTAPGTIYFDLAAGDVTISANAQGNGTYSGYVYKKNETTGNVELVSVSDSYNKYNDKGEENNYHFYVYQSTARNKETIWDGDVCTPPKYDPVKLADGTLWSDFITNNDSVESVIEKWDINHNKLVEDVGRINTNHRIQITGNVTCDLTIDNIYSAYQDPNPTSRRTGGISFEPQHPNIMWAAEKSVKNAKVTVKILGDNRVGAVHYCNVTDKGTSPNGNEIIFEGTGSLTVADVDGNKVGSASNGDSYGLSSGQGYWSNHWSSAIGGCDDGAHEEADGITINSGIIFAGTTKMENCTALGGGGNAYGVVTINSGTVTAVATTTGTAIGGGIGYSVNGGVGLVNINNGNVYAYNKANRWNIPSSAIGGAGSKGSYGEKGTVTITGGYVYAYSALGTAIGGGSSYTMQGGEAHITITGGEIFAKTGSDKSSSIGGGTACTGVNSKYNGGSATITIFGNPIIRTGSIGGGGKGIGSGYIGNANIHVYGGDIQAQFLLSSGTAEGQVPSFDMTGGVIRNSNTADTEYLHVKPDGGAVYMENGRVNISGGEIRNCTAERGGAIYILGLPQTTGGTSKATFTMSNGTIKDNEATLVDDKEGFGGGGAIYMIDGTVDIEGGNILDNLAAGGNGGGIFIRRGDLTVSGNTLIKGNACEVRRDGENLIGGNGGGIYAYSSASSMKIDLISGQITGNTADRRGGGLCVIMNNGNYEANVTLGTEGSNNNDALQITGNHTLLQGGGVYAKGATANIIVNSGTIDGNTVSQYVHNKDVANDGGTVTLNGGLVKHNIVTFDANGGTIYVDGVDTGETKSEQKIVTETNSKLVAPTVQRVLFDFEGWNTKPSGAGTDYKDGDIMNIYENITLYAKWKRK